MGSTIVTGLVLPAEDSAATAPYWILRLGAALCFIGHGAFGFITKTAWVPYFGVVGIPEHWAFDLMPMVGAVDVLAGMAVLFGPTRFPLLYMVAWAAWTALLRPLAGESAFETLERAGNFGVPLALLVLVGAPRSWRDLFAALPPRTVAPERMLVHMLQWTTALLLIGHGALAISGKPLLVAHHVALGLPADATPMLGWLEIALAAAVLIRPSPPLLFSVVFWKLATEALFPLTGAPVWEFVERAGSYAAPAALAFILARARR
jgi:hypothetical protein